MVTPFWAERGYLLIGTQSVIEGVLDEKKTGSLRLNFAKTILIYKINITAVDKVDLSKLSKLRKTRL